MDIAEQIESLGIVPVIKIDHPEDARPLGQALVDGGLPLAEVTFRTEGAEKAIGTLAGSFPEMLVGAGTVLNVENAEKAIKAGARFIVSPGFNPQVVDYCMERDMPVFPGVNSPSQIEMGLARGLKVLKFFPAEASGGLKALKAMAAAYGQVRFMPTGGISRDNIGDYLQFDRILACGGSWMVKGDLISSGKFDEITRLAREAVLRAIGFEFAHMGINCPEEAGAASLAGLFSSLFGMESREGNSSFFLNREIEVNKGAAPGSHGHIALKVNRIGLAKAYLKRKGYAFRPGSAKYKNGRLIAEYLKDEMGGFAVHLLQA